jgi:hypothetical protein
MIRRQSKVHGFINFSLIVNKPYPREHVFSEVNMLTGSAIISYSFGS